MQLIFHITGSKQWDQAQSDGAYRGDTLATEGFIHCSTSAQVARVANARFQGRYDLVLLCIDAERLTAELRYELGEVDEEFPHIYGPLNVGAVVRVLPFVPGDDGRFVLLASVMTGFEPDHAA